MKRILSLCLVITACNQPYPPPPALPSDTISAATHAVLNMRPQNVQPDTISSATEAVLNMRSEESNSWVYNTPMGGETYRYAHSAILKANNRKAHLKLFNDPPINRVILQLEGDKFNEDVDRKAAIQVKFDDQPAASYTCAIDPTFGFLKLPIEFIKQIKKAHTVTITGEMLRMDTTQRSKQIGYTITHRRSRNGSYRRRGRWEEVKEPIVRNWNEINSTSIKTNWKFNCSGLTWNY